MAMLKITKEHKQFKVKNVLLGEEHPLPKEIRLHRVFEQVLQDHPKDVSKTAIIFEDASKTYREINSMSNLLARVILDRSRIRLDAQEGRTPLVAVCMDPSDKLILTLLAILKTGAAYVALDTTFPPNRICQILENSRPALVIYHGKQSITLQQALAKIEATESFQVQTQDYEQLEEWTKTSKLSEDNLRENETVQSVHGLACVLYTSGSTGIPKGVMVAHDRIMNRLLWGWRTFPYSDDEVCCFKTNLTFVDSVAEIFGPLLKLKQLIVFPVSTTRCIGTMISTLKEYKCRRLVVVPSVIRSILLRLDMLPQSEDHLPDLKLWISSGERLPKELLDQFFSRYPSGRKVCNLYGSTEVTADVTCATFTSAGQGLIDGKVPIGIPVDNTSIYLLDEELQQVPLGEIGEICVGGLNVNPGYLNETSEISLNFINDPFTTALQGVPSTMYRTRDFGKIVDGVVMYEGRTDSQVKIRGQRVDLSEVESAMLTLPGVDKAVVLIRKPKGKDEAPKLVGFYTLVPEGPSLSFRDVVAHLRNSLSSAMMPLPFPVKSFPLLHNGKVARQQLMNNFETYNDTWEPVNTTNEDPLGKVLLDAVSAVVGIKNPYILNLDNNFYDMGGDSLNSVLLLMDLQNSGYNIQIHDLLGSQSLRDLIPKMRVPSTINIPSVDAPQIKVSDQRSHDDHPQLNTESVEIRPLAQVPRDEAIHMIADSFAYKGQLECCVGATPEDYHILLNDLWEWLIEVGLSFGVFSQDTGELLAVSISYDFHNTKEMNFPPGVQPVFNFLEDIEAPLRRKFAGNEKLMHSSMMATADVLTGQENVMMIILMEETNIRIAKQHNYKYIVTTNTNPLTRDVCRNIMGYEVFSEMYLKQYLTANGDQPFKCCSPDLTIEVVYKRIE